MNSKYVIGRRRGQGDARVLEYRQRKTQTWGPERATAHRYSPRFIRGVRPLLRSHEFVRLVAA